MRDLSNEVFYNLFGAPKQIKFNNEDEQRKGFYTGNAYVVGKTFKEYESECFNTAMFGRSFLV